MVGQMVVVKVKGFVFRALPAKKKSKKGFSPRLWNTTTRIWNHLRSVEGFDMRGIQTKKQLLERLATFDERYRQYFQYVPMRYVYAQVVKLKDRKGGTYVGKTNRIRKEIAMRGIRNKNVVVRETRQYISLYSIKGKFIFRFKKRRKKSMLTDKSLKEVV
jgi:hypothetical protein